MAARWGATEPVRIATASGMSAEDKWPTTPYSLLAGVLFGSGWLLWIDGFAAANADDHNVSLTYCVPGILSTLSLIMLNVISWTAVSSDDLLDDAVGVAAKAWVFFSLCLAFAGLIMAVWLAIAADGADVHTAQRVVWQSALIFAASLIFRVPRALKAD